MEAEAMMGQGFGEAVARAAMHGLIILIVIVAVVAAAVGFIVGKCT